MKEVPSLKEMEKLLNSIPNLRDRALFSLMYWSGRRISEALGVERKDIDTKETSSSEPFITVSFNILKKKKPLAIKTPFPLDNPLSEPFVDYLAYFDKNSYCGKIFKISPQQAWKIIKRVDPELRTHWFRHCRATHLGTVMEATELCAYFGWSDVKMALRYTHSNPELVLNKMKKIGEK